MIIEERFDLAAPIAAGILILGVIGYILLGLTGIGVILWEAFGKYFNREARNQAELEYLQSEYRNVTREGRRIKPMFDTRYLRVTGHTEDYKYLILEDGTRISNDSRYYSIKY